MDNEKDQYFANKNSSQRISYPNGKFNNKNFILYYKKLN